MLYIMKKSIFKVLIILGLMHFKVIFAATPCYLTVLNETQFDSAVVGTSVHSLLTKYMRPYLQIPAEGLSSKECLDSVQVKIDSNEPDKIYVLLEQAEQSYIGSGDTIDISGIQQATLRILMDISNATKQKILCKKYETNLLKFECKGGPVESVLYLKEKKINNENYTWDTSTKWQKRGDRRWDLFYKGESLNRLPHGKGVLNFPDGEKYVGEFKKGQIYGHGKITWTDGAYYEGRFINGLKHGHGEEVPSLGGKYVGNFKNDLYDGLGTLTYRNGSVYVGEFKEGNPHGTGRIVEVGGKTYNGEWKEGKMNGQGTLEDKKNGMLFKGEMRNNDMWNGIATYKEYGNIVKRRTIVNGVAK